MSSHSPVRPRNRFLSGSFIFLTVSVLGSVVLFWRPWASNDMEPGSVDGLLLTGFLIMIILGLAGMAVGLIRYLDAERRAPQT